MRAVAVVLGAVLLMATGCEGRQVSEPDPEGTNATVRFVNVEGGCWVLVSESGTTFEPTALPAGYQQDGLSVRFAYQARNDVGSFCMVGGEIVEITSIATR
jgi:hypothetical protein